MIPLGELRVLALDCQATAANPSKGHLLEVGWSLARAVDTCFDVQSHLLRLPDGVSISPRVARVTGITTEATEAGETPARVWESLASAAGESSATVIHFSRFEEPYLRWLQRTGGHNGDFPSRIVCTHEMTKRLLPDLPRRGLRAVAGYFGHSVSERRRAGEHVVATMLVWRSLVECLRRQVGVETLEELLSWLDQPVAASRERRFPMRPSARRSIPARPGIYRMLRSNGDVLYVGKATSLRERIASYFRRSAAHGEHTLEMLSQARELETVVTRSALEAALLETDEIKRLDPPYNTALRVRDRDVLFGSRDLRRFSVTPHHAHPMGPLVGRELWSIVASLHDDEVPTSWADDIEVFQDGLELFRRGVTGAFLAHGTRLWMEQEEKEPDVGELQLRVQYDVGARSRWTPESVARYLNEVARRAAHLVRRGHWLSLLSESTLDWEARSGESFSLSFGSGRIATPLYEKPFSKRRESFDLDTYDRLVVLTRELRRLVEEGREIRLRIGRETALEASKLEGLLRWV